MTNGLKRLICAAPALLLGEFTLSVVVVVADLMVWELLVDDLGSCSAVVSMYALPIGSPWQTWTDSILKGGLCANALGMVVPIAISTDSL